MSGEFKKAAWLFVGLGITYLLDLISDPVKSTLIEISPLSMWRLSVDHLIALVLTLSSAFIAWFIAIVGGYALAHIVGIVTIHKQAHKSLQWISSTVQHGYNILYIIPLVITLSLTYALLMSHSVKGNIPNWSVVIGTIAVAGLALGGYQVFKSISGAVTRAGDGRIFLARSLFSSDARSKEQTVGSHLRSLTIVSRLADFEVRSFVGSIEIAFHLAVVGIIILETITPNLYELVFPQSAVAPAWAGGVGRLILAAQANYQFQDIAGMLWAIVAVDFLAVIAINMFAQHRWLQYYRSHS